jgi:hypothetical protein
MPKRRYTDVQIAFAPRQTEAATRQRIIGSGFGTVKGQAVDLHTPKPHVRRLSGATMAWSHGWRTCRNADDIDPELWPYHVRHSQLPNRPRSRA